MAKITLTDGRSIAASSDEGRHVLRHSTAHVMAQAVSAIFPGAKYAIGPAIDDGFYYDFDIGRPFTPEDLDAIDAKMREIIAAKQPFVREAVSRDEGLQRFLAKDQPFKVEIIRGVEEAEGGGEEISIYSNDGWEDLCLGPHVENTGLIPAFKLMRVAGAYWRGDEHNPMLQRIYGTAWESEEALEQHLHMLEEAERRDHRKLGRDLDMFSWADEVGPGLALWHPKGALVRKTLEDLSREMHLNFGYQPVFTPHLGRATLWEVSGHLGYYRENMFPGMQADDGSEYIAKPMNCPFHILIFRSRTRSYRDLPIRFSELGTVYRYERSGTLHGLLRARGLTQDDSHIFCRPEQVVDELLGVIEFFRALYATVGMGPDRVRFSTRPEKSVGSDQLWDMAQAAIPEALQRAGIEFTVDEGDGTFYGPKIDIDVRDAIGRYWQVATIQVDFNLPERFGLEYTDEDNVHKRPVMIHRALYGSMERFVGVLVEHYAGAFPTWLAPVQAVIVPIADRHAEHAVKLGEDLRARGVRVDVDDSRETMQLKVRNAEVQKVPYILVVGDKEIENATVAVRARGMGKAKFGVSFDDFASEIAAEIAGRELTPRYS
ncbi:MAG TPA: threonine--tRNA ligase [Actinomycetota bacterium]|nr:threonine--tRNA ligase [Actinomycetota bacterium]